MFGMNILAFPNLGVPSFSDLNFLTDCMVTYFDVFFEDVLNLFSEETAHDFELLYSALLIKLQFKRPSVDYY